MYDTAVELMKSGRVDEADVDELERVINVLVAKWESIDNRLNASRDRQDLRSLFQLSFSSLVLNVLT